MGSFGKNLRRERELRGISLEEIAEHTKVSARMLDAIENDRFSALPGGIFTRSFVLHYARYLGLDEQKIASEFDMFVGDSPVDIHRVAAQREQHKPHAPPMPVWLERLQQYRTQVAVLFAVAIAVLCLYLLRPYAQPYVSRLAARVGDRMARFRPPANPPPVRYSPAAPPVTPLAAVDADTGAAGGAAAGSAAAAASPAAGQAPAPESEASKAPAPSGASSPLAAAAPAHAGQPLLLQVDTVEDAWVEVIADGRRQWSAELKARDMRQVRATSSIELKTGNAGAVVLTLNGETQPPLGRRGEVKVAKFSLEDLKKP